MPQSEVSGLSNGMELIFGGDERSIEEDLLAFGLGDPVTEPILFGVATIPVKFRGVGTGVHGSNKVYVGRIRRASARFLLFPPTMGCR